MTDLIAGAHVEDAGLARRLLGRPFRISGEVIHGSHLGRTIGFLHDSQEQALARAIVVAYDLEIALLS